MIHTFKPVAFPADFDSFLNFRKLADLEVLGSFNYDADKMQAYINKNLQALGPDAFLHFYVNDRLIVTCPVFSYQNYIKRIKANLKLTIEEDI